MHYCERLFLELAAAEARDHDALVGQVKLLLRADLFPGVLHKEGQPVHRDVLSIIRTWEQAIRGFHIEAGAELRALLEELLLLEDLVREHAVLEVKEVLRATVFKGIRLVNLVPDIGNILVDNRSDALEVVAPVVKVSEHE